MTLSKRDQHAREIREMAIDEFINVLDNYVDARIDYRNAADWAGRLRSAKDALREAIEKLLT